MKEIASVQPTLFAIFLFHNLLDNNQLKKHPIPKVNRFCHQNALQQGIKCKATDKTGIWSLN